MENYFENKEWLRDRLGRFTSSEIHKLFVSGKKKGEMFGVGANTYIRTKVAELLTLEVKDEIDFKQAEWGKANEYEAVQAFEHVSKLKGTYYGAGNPKFFPLGEYAGGSPDWESNDAREGADIKCPFNSSVHVENLMIQNPAQFEEARWEYYCQAQMNMIVRNWEKFHFVSYDPRMVDPAFSLKIITIYPDDKWKTEFFERLNAAVTKMNEIIGLIETPATISEPA